MSLSVRPDPARPHGGYAVFELPAAAVDGDAAEVAVFDTYGERYLGGSGWQGERATFGPYPVERDGDTARLTVGPEIVNVIEEYAALRIEVGGTAHRVAWPDDVVPRPGAPHIGTILAHRAEPERESALVGGAAAEPETPPEPETPKAARPEPRPAPPPQPKATQSDPPARARAPMLLAGLAVALAVAVAAWFLLLPGEEPSPAPVAAADPCTPEAISALRTADFATRAERLRTCGAAVSPDQALAAIEDGADAGDPDALLLFGEVYDGEATDAAFEDLIGVTFDDDPARAATYYARAAEAGSATAEERLAAVCARLAGRADTLSASAVQDHCNE